MEGFVLNIPDDMLKNLDKADAALAKLGTTADTTKTKVIDAFKDINRRGLQSFTDRLNNASKKLEELGKKKVAIQFDAPKNIMDSINNIINGVNQVNNVTNNSQGNTILDDTKLQEENLLIADLKNNIKAIDKLLKEKVDTQKQPLTEVTQQQLVDLKSQYQEDLKMQEQSSKKKIETEKKTAEEIEKQKEREIKAERKAYEEKRKIYQAQNKLKNQTFEGAIKFSNNANTINREILAIKNLEAARNSLSKTDVNYKKKLDQLNSAILRHKVSIDNATSGAKNLQNAHKGLLNTSEQLTRKLALVFSVSQVIGYASKLVSIRGEFELQQRSLQAILKDKEQANKLFNQITQLAVQSPFQLKELVTYTKQLAAYRIETGKLYDTTKMLADISAGVGVDMSRLVLAYGQVSSANYLRGTELRQFSEAGINVLGGLADYFSELEGRIVGVDEVFERVSKRMVLFEDVEEVLKRMTSEGGDFYRMQEIQSQTLKGQVSNLKDSIDIMMNEIGKNNDGTLKHLVSLIRSAVDNWRIFAVVLKMVGGTLMAISFAQFIKGLTTTNDKIQDLIKTGNSFTAMGAKFKQALGMITAHPFVAVATAIAATGYAIYEHNKKVQELNRVYDENSTSLLKSVDKLEDLETQVKKVNGVIESSSKIMAKNEQGTEEYNDAENKLAFARQENATLLKKIEAEYPSIYDEIVKQADGIIDLTAAIEKYNEQIEFSISLEQRKKGDFWHEDLATNYADAKEELDEYITALDVAKSEAITVQSALKAAFEDNKISKEQFDVLNGLIQNIKEAKGYDAQFKSIKDLYQELYKAGQANWGVLVGNNGIFQKFSESYNETVTQKTGQGWGIGYLDALKDFEHNLDEEAVIIKGKWEELSLDMTTNEGKQAALDWGNKLLDDLGIVDAEIRKYAQKWMNQKLHIEIDWDFKGAIGENGELEKNDWVDAVEEELMEVLKKIPNKIQSEVTKELYLLKDSFKFDMPNANEDFEQYAKKIKKQFEEITKLKEQAHTQGQALFTKKEVAEIDAGYASIKRVMEILGLLGEKKGGGAKKDRMKDMVGLIREMNREYKRLNKTLDHTKAKQRILDSYATTFKRIFKGTGIKMEDVDFIDEEGVVASLAKLREIANSWGEEARTILEHNISQVEIDIELQVKKDQDKDLLGELNGMIDDYELSLDLQANHITPDQARNLFGLDALTLPQLKDVAKQFESQIKGGEPTEEYKKVLKRIDELEEKQQQERLKKYLNYTRDAIGERAKIKLEEMQKLEEIEESFKPKKDATEEEIKAMEEAKMAAILGVQKEAREQMDKYDWTEFQKTDTFVSIFNDLENTSNLGLENMIQKLEEFKAQWTDMPLDQMKQVIELLDKLKSEQNERAGDANPFSRMRNLRTEISDNSAYGTTMPEIDANIAKDEEEIFSTQQELDLLDIEIQKTIELKDVKNDITVSDEAHLNSVNLRLKSLQNEKDKLQSIIKELEKDKKLTEDQKKRLQEVATLYSKQAKNLKEVQDMANNLYNAFKDLAEVLGADMDSDAAIFADMGMDMTNMVLSTLQMQMQVWGIKKALDIAGVSAKSFGYALNTAMGIIGWIVMAIQLIVEGINAATKVHDNRLQKQIEKDAKAVEELKERYEELEVAIENAMAFGTYKSTFDEMQATQEKIIERNQSMMAAEEEKKKSDEEEIDKYKENIKEAQKEIAENREKLLEDMGGFGSAENMKSAAEGFVDVWFDAYKETGSGLNALEGKWDEYYDNLLKKQLLMKVGERWVEQYLKKVDSMLSEDSAGGIELTKEELSELNDAREKGVEELNTVLTNYAKAIGLEGGMPELEGLSKSIQGVTETTAQALEALLNSMRFYVIDTNSELKDLAEDFRDFSLNSFDAVVNEMRSQTNLIDTIKNMIDDVIIPAQGGNGKALYVSM